MAKLRNQEMKTAILATAVLASLTISAAGKNDSSGLDPQPYFSAVVVSDLDSSAAWYQSALGLTARRRMSEPERGFRILELESRKLFVELIENKSSLAPKHLLAGKPEGTLIQGFFKIGFKVSHMDACINHLRGLNIPLGQIYEDSASQKRNFLIHDPDGNLIQFFE
jgi:catechol 2,3-dioxygenase-like lactoylglutathione lyase family enzyme